MPDHDHLQHYERLQQSVGARFGTRDVVEAKGADTAKFLQGQLSQDVAAMAPGETRRSLLLAPQGKVDAYLRVTRTDADRYLLDVDAGWADAVVTRLSRFRLRTACDLSVLAWQSVTLIGPEAPAVDIEGAEVAMALDWPGVTGVEAFGPELTLMPDVAEVDEAAIEAIRIEAGEPKMGSELDESTIPAAAGVVDRTVSFTKGCFTGQELVARIDSRGGNVPRRLVGVLVNPEVPVSVGDPMMVEGKVVGQLTSLAFSPRFSAPIALAYAGRAVADTAEVTIGGGQHRLVPLPFATPAFS